MHHILVRNFTLLSEPELLMILERRNHPEVRKWMINPDPIPREEHLRYCASLAERPDVLQLLVEFDGQPACVLSYKASDASWQEIKDCGIYAFDPEPCSSFVLSEIVGCQLVGQRATKTIKISVRNDNEVAIFANQYYHGFQITHKDDELTYMEAKVMVAPSALLARSAQLLAKIPATLELKL